MRKKGMILFLGLLFSIVFTWRLPLVDQDELPDDFLLIAHRGASAYAPEHTLSAYQLAYDYGADYLEIDLQQTKDGVLVAFHDQTIERTTNGTGSLSDYTYEELKNLNAGSWYTDQFPDRSQEGFEDESVVSLEDILEAFGREAMYYIETKQPFTNGQMEIQLIQILEQYRLLENVIENKQVILQSFSEDSLLALHDLNPDIPLVHLFNFKNEPADLSPAELDSLASYASGIGVNKNSLTKSFGEKVAERGLMLHVYTVNSYSDALDAYRKGAEGIFTDDLLEFMATLAQ